MHDNRKHQVGAFAMTVVLCVGGFVQAQQPLPAHPNELKYAPLDFKLPPPSELREVLSTGTVVYIAEDRMLPTFDLTVTLRAASATDPEGKIGLASLAGEQLRDGGTKDLSPAELDERLEFLAASLSSNIGETRGRVRLSCLSKDVDEALRLLVDVLRYPRFDAERLRLAKERMLQNVKRRNDSTASIAGIEWGFMMNGEGHFSNWYPSSRTINNIVRDDLVAFHRKYIHPGNMILAVSGDFDRGAMLRKLEALFADWPVGETGPTSFPEPVEEPEPGVYLMHKEGVNQGRVTIGHKSIKRGTPDEFPLRVMNGILGGAGFKSRLFTRIRSDEGLAYNTGSRFDQGVYYPGDFRCWFQSKSNSCAYATQLVLDQIDRLRNERVDDAELAEFIAFYVESFPQRFSTKMAVLETYVSDEYTGRDPAYWQNYIDNVKRVTPEDVLRVAQRHLHPHRLVILGVGDAPAIRHGGHDNALYLRFDEFGDVELLPLRDPDTLLR
ncbi:MAG: pitrilysin family protein [Phycisphaerae bacterium]|jgi:predicted Zn-dependent peptidase